MKKLLHELLREWATDGYKELTGDDLLALADEIERYYIPRPRFEDGEPVPWYSEDVEWKHGSCNEFRITAIKIDGTPIADNGDEILAEAKMRNGFVVRKESKVLDAEGVPIEVGDTLWYTDNLPAKCYVGDRVVVRNIANGLIDVYNTVHEHEQFEITGDSLTHKEPDSLKKLRDDMASWNDLRMKTFCMEWIDRLSALIERGA